MIFKKKLRIELYKNIKNYYRKSIKFLFLLYLRVNHINLDIMSISSRMYII